MSGRMERVLDKTQHAAVTVAKTAQSALAMLDVLRVPGLREQRTSGEKIVDERPHPHIPEIVGEIGAKLGEQAARTLFPFRDQRRRGVVEEDETEQIPLTGPVASTVKPAAKQRPGRRVPAAGVPERIKPVGRAVQQPDCRPQRNQSIRTVSVTGVGIDPAGQFEHVASFGRRQRQRDGQPFQRLRRGANLAALLYPCAPRGADAGACRQFLATQTRRAPPASRLRWRQAFAVSADKFAEQSTLVILDHDSFYTRIRFSIVIGYACGIRIRNRGDKMTQTHKELVEAQFGPRAAAYVESAVHAQGEDLAALEAVVAAIRPERALDLGAGGGHVSYLMARHAGSVTAADLSPEMLAAVRETARAKGLGNIGTIEAAVEKLPFADGVYDFVASRYSAHHWHDFEGGLREARRVARHGATAVFMDVFASETPLLDTHLQAVELLRDMSHVRDHSLSEWLRAAGRAGFVTEGHQTWRVRMDFPVWIARMQTPETNVRAIRALQQGASEEVRRHFAIEADGSFMLDVMMIRARAT